MDIEKEYIKKKYEDILRYCKGKFNSLDAKEKYYLGIVLFELGFLNKSLELLLEIEKVYVDVDKSRGYAYMGLVYYSLGNYKKTKRYLKYSINLNGEYSIESKNWYKLYALDGEVYKVVKQPHITYYFIEKIDLKEVENFILKYKRAYDRIQSFFSVILQKKIDVYIYCGRRDVLGNNLSYANPFFSSIHVNKDEDAGHELAHIISHYAVTRINNKSKLIQEGIAEYFNLINYKTLIYPIGLEINLFQLWNDMCGLNSVSYACIAKRFVSLLIDRKGKDIFIKLLQDQSTDNALNLYGECLLEAKDVVEREVIEGKLQY